MSEGAPPGSTSSAPGAPATPVSRMDATASGNADPPRGVTGSISRELLRLALPVYASHLLRTSYQWVDALWVRGLGVDATAAVTTSVFVMWSALALTDVFGIGVSAYVSQLLGAGERRRAGVASYLCLRATGLLGLAGTLAGLFAARPLCALLTHDPGVIAQSTSYLSIVLAAAPLLMMSMVAESIMRAAGDTRTPLVIDLGAVLLNVVLDPLLIYGWGPFPRMGVAGAAWATVIAQAVMLASYLGLAARGHRAFPLARTAPGVPIRIGGMARVGIPGALVGLLFSVVYVAFARSAGRFGAAALAVVGIAIRIEAMHFVSSIALGFAAATLVGQNLGARRPDRAALALRTANLWNLCISLAVGVTFFCVPGVFVNLFSHDAEVHRIGVDYVRIIALCLPFVGAEIVTTEGIVGSGRIATISAIFTAFSLLRIPLAFWIPQWTGLGVLGIAWLITGTAMLRASLIMAWAARGTWRLGLTNELASG